MVASQQGGWEVCWKIWLAHRSVGCESARVGACGAGNVNMCVCTVLLVGHEEDVRYMGVQGDEGYDGGMLVGFAKA